MPAAANQFIDHLNAKLARLMAELEQSEVYHLFLNTQTDARLIGLVIKHYLLEVFSFGPHVTEATFTAIGRFPKDRPDLMKPMILHDLEEVNHGEMALQDYLKLGGNEQHARSRRLTPASFAMAATCRMLAERESPFCYLGYMYLFEALTPILAERVRTVLSARGFPMNARFFIDFHATEDVTHAQELAGMIGSVLADYPEAAAAIDYGFDCFACVYPMPILEAALKNAREELGLM